MNLPAPPEPDHRWARPARGPCLRRDLPQRRHCFAGGRVLGSGCGCAWRPPDSRETEVLAPENLVGRAHAIMLNGGSVFGLAANGAMAARQEFELGRAGAGRGAMADLITGGLGSAAADCLAHTIAGAV